MIRRIWRRASAPRQRRCGAGASAADTGVRADRRRQRHRQPAGSITTRRPERLASSAATAAVAISNRTSAMIDIAQVQGQVHAQSVQKVGELADRNPNETVAIIRAWLHENAA